ncbi:hypothetical protein Q6247_26805, partial [Klebsiella pneumoniae]
MEENEWKNHIHVIESALMSHVGNEKKFRTFCSRNTTTNVFPNDFKILKNQTMSENDEIRQDV